jgi:hypothetical protein
MAYDGLPEPAASSLESSRRTSARNLDPSVALAFLLILGAGLAGSIVFIAVGTYRRQGALPGTLQSRIYWYRIQVTGLILLPWFVGAFVFLFPSLATGQLDADVAFLGGTALAGCWLPMVPIRWKFGPGSLGWTRTSVRSG